MSRYKQQKEPAESPKVVSNFLQKQKRQNLRHKKQSVEYDERLYINTTEVKKTPVKAPESPSLETAGQAKVKR